MNIRIKTEQRCGQDFWLSEVSFLVASEADPTDYLYSALDEWHGYTTTGEIFKGTDYRAKAEELRQRWKIADDHRKKLIAENAELREANRKLEKTASLATKAYEVKAKELYIANSHHLGQDRGES